MTAVLFVCVHNTGRSQMAAGFLRDLTGGTVDVYSAGSEPADDLNSVAVQAMLEHGIDIADVRPIRVEIRGRVKALIAGLAQ